MGMINSTIQSFSATALKKGEFVYINEQDVLGKWASSFFYPADFTFVCPTEPGDVADNCEELRELGVEVLSVSTDTHSLACFLETRFTLRSKGLAQLLSSF